MPLRFVNQKSGQIRSSTSVISGQRGDDVTDDTDAFRKALQAAEQNGGGLFISRRAFIALTESFAFPAGQS